jgi:hypothetical protein
VLTLKWIRRRRTDVVVELVVVLRVEYELELLTPCCGLTREMIVMVQSYLGRRSSMFWGYCE